MKELVHRGYSVDSKTSLVAFHIPNPVETQPIMTRLISPCFCARLSMNYPVSKQSYMSVEDVSPREYVERPDSGKVCEDAKAYIRSLH
jgi:hypothetical protein